MLRGWRGMSMWLSQTLTQEVQRPWSRRQESNLYLPLRRRPFYPLNYGEVGVLRGAILGPLVSGSPPRCRIRSSLSRRRPVVPGYQGASCSPSGLMSLACGPVAQRRSDANIFRASASLV